MVGSGNKALDQKRYQALVGALVADAATMGLHWMYDQEHIEKVALSGEILFRQPDAEVYRNQKAYFAHEAKSVGENSQYGECVRVVARAIEAEGSYTTEAHRRIFFETFGPCGSYHGFADRPTKALIAKMILDGDDIADQSGSDDDQLPALCAVPALFSYDQSAACIAPAVSVTSINVEALSGAAVLFNCLEQIIQGESLPRALEVAISEAEPDLAALLQQALELPSYDPLGAANHFGMPCHIKQGLPVAWHLLKYASDYTTVVRDNIRCGGDSCGRSMAVGSIAGLVFGVPEALSNRLNGS